LIGYGIPGMSNEKMEQNIETALSFGIPHISSYALTVEPKRH
jgi:oxygen-independent coproporphyrinogen-3 oxidase